MYSVAVNHRTFTDLYSTQIDGVQEKELGKVHLLLSTHLQCACAVCTAPGPSAPPLCCTAADTQTARQWLPVQRQEGSGRRASAPQTLLWCVLVPTWGRSGNYEELVMGGRGEEGDGGDLCYQL